MESIDLQWFGNPVPIHNRKINYNLLTLEDVGFYDVIILVAAHSSVPLCESDKVNAFKNNVSNFIELINKIQPHQKFIYASSSCVYINADCASETSRLDPTDMLSYTKTAIDQYAQAMNPCQYYGLRFGSVGGWSPNLRPDLLVNAMTLGALSRGEVKVSNGNCRRPILGMNDLGRAVIRVIESKEDKRGIYNIASFNKTIGQVGERIASLFKAKIFETPSSKTYDFQIDTSKFSQSFNFIYNDTLETIVDSIVENKDRSINLKSRVSNEL